MEIAFLLFYSAFANESTSPEDAYQKAHTLLSQIRPSSSRTSTSAQATVTRYLKAVVTSFFFSGPPSQSSDGRKLPPPLVAAEQLLRDAAELDHVDSIYTLADMNFFGNYSHPRNYTEAFNLYHRLAELDGNSSAQHMVGFMYATGVGGAVKQDQAKAMLYYNFAAEQGNTRSEMTMAYRYNYGIATSRNCEKAVYYWRKVAEKVIDYIRTGPPGNHVLTKNAYRIADNEGGIYGEGASVSSAGMNAKQGGPSSDAHAAVEDVIEYLDLISRKGDLKATMGLGKLHYEGSRTMRRDFRLAKQYFLEVARQYWSKGGKVKSDVPSQTERLASKAAGFLGRMFLRGEGIEQSFDIARTWFKRGISNGDALSQYSLGIMYLDGLGVKRDPERAAQLFSAAADQDFGPAQVRLGVLFLDTGDVTIALRYFDLAARNGQTEALYYLAELTFGGIGRDSSCPMAAHYFKLVAEKAESVVSSFTEANEAYEVGDNDMALIDYMLAAEQGFEVAQTNVAFILDKARPRTFNLPFADLLPLARRKITLLTDSALALIYWTRSARQSNIDALVKMGDYYLSGTGTQPDQEKAAACYQAAAETMQSAQALWNLGWMHENGLGGVEQDFHLAKRFYDQAFETNREAYLPVKLALIKVRLRSVWNSWTRGGVKSIIDETRKFFSLPSVLQNPYPLT